MRTNHATPIHLRAGSAFTIKREFLGDVQFDIAKLRPKRQSLCIPISEPTFEVRVTRSTLLIWAISNNGWNRQIVK